ncbi:MAG: dTDP-glucose 4,6-dehydratase [Planctomyces sp.]|nr:dTDP-glucose 4,6-dehydratase [Planctomyces sp.]
MKSILVTGGCGFIGSNFIRLQRQLYPDQTVHNVDKLTYAGNPENLADLEGDDRYQFHQLDICDRVAILDLLTSTKPAAILNFAAESHVDRSIIDSGPFVQTNIVGTQVLLDAAREVGISRFVQVSTDEVYGSLGAEGYFTEETPLAPNSPYSASKAAADLLVRSYVHTFDFPAVITRCSNNYGPYQFPEKLIPLFISNAMEDKPLPVYGTGENVRDWIHVLDHCRGIDAALRQGEIGEVYNFGGHHELTNLEMTHILIELLEKSRELITFVKDRPGHDLRYAIDCTKAEQQLSWSPEISFEQGIRDTIAWYQSHTDWVNRIKTGEYLKYIEKQYAGRMKK